MERQQSSDDSVSFGRNRQNVLFANNLQLPRDLHPSSSNLSSESVPQNLVVGVHRPSINGRAASSGHSQLASASTTMPVGFDNDSANGNNFLAVGPNRMSINGGSSSSNHSQLASTSATTPMRIHNGSANWNGNGNDFLHELTNPPGLPYLRDRPSRMTINSALNNNDMGANRLLPRPNTGYQPNQIHHDASISVSAMTIQGCHHLRRILEQGNWAINEVIITEVTNDLPFLMTHQIGYAFTLSVFQSCDEQQMNRILQSVLLENQQNFPSICQHYHGSEAAMALLANLKSPEQQTLVATFLREHILCFTNIHNAQLVLRFFIQISNDYIRQLLLNKMAGRCIAIATNRLGCLIVQQVICPEYIESNVAQFLLWSIVTNSLLLSEDEFGNYVVQHVIMSRANGVAQGIVSRLSGRFVDLAKNKFGSNVVETCLVEFEEGEVVGIVTELMNSRDLLSVVQDPFGNFVMQTALTQASKRGMRGLFDHMVKSITDVPSLLHAHPYGRKVLHKIDQLSSNSMPKRNHALMIERSPFRLKNLNI